MIEIIPNKLSLFEKVKKLFGYDNNIKIPTEWTDLTPDQYLGTVEELARINTSITIHDIRLRLLQLYTGYKRGKKKQKPDDAENINSNLVILADKIKFPVKPEYNDKQPLNVLPANLKNKLLKIFPYDIHEPEEIREMERIKSFLNFKPTINLNFKCNPLPVIYVDGIKHHGPAFKITKSGVLITDMLTCEYIDAWEYYTAYNKTQDITHLDGMIAVLYRKNRRNYDLYEAQINAAKISEDKKITDNHRYGVKLFFESVIEYLSSHHIFRYLFHGKDKDAEKGKIKLGMSAVIDSLVKENFGCRTEIMNMTVDNYFNILVKQIKDAVNMLRENDMKNYKIAQKLEIPLEFVAKL